MLETVFSEVIILFAVVSASISSIIVTKNLFRSSPLHAKERNRFTLSIAELEKDNKKLRGKVNQMKQPISIKEHPEEIKNVLSKLVNKKPNAKEQTNEQSTIDSMSV